MIKLTEDESQKHDKLEECLSMGVTESEKRCVEIIKDQVKVPVSIPIKYGNLFSGTLCKTVKDVVDALNS